MQKSQHVFITGGASGIGLQLARDYVIAGHHVSLFDRQPMADTLNTLQALAKPHQIVQACALDVTDETMVINAFAEAARKSPPDTIIHCAGIALARPFTETSADTFETMLRINLIGSRNVAAQSVRYLQAGGHLVLFASMAGLVGCYGYTAYSASKYGVVGLAEVLRIELAPRNIAVSVVCPPEVETPMVVEERKHRSLETETLKLLTGTLSVEQAATEIRKQIAGKKFMIIPGRKARWLRRISRLTPDSLSHAITDFLIRRVQRRKHS